MAISEILDDEAAVPPLTRGDDELSAPLQDEIAELAYSYWEARGFQGGSPWEDWFRAERELMEREQRENALHRRETRKLK
jgi:hypothetical protein